jgi:hypothetical protein
MKQSDCYDASYTTSNLGRADRIRPAITAKRAREIFAAAQSKMDPNKRATINKGLTVGQAFEILSKAVTTETPDGTALHSLVSRNIVREFGKFLPDSFADSIARTRSQQINSMVEDSGYTRAEATALVDGGF